MSIEYSTTVGYGYVLDDSGVQDLVEAGLAEVIGSDTIADGGIFEVLPGAPLRWPHLRFSQARDQWAGTIPSRVLVVTESSSVTIDEEYHDGSIPGRLGSADQTEHDELVDLARLLRLDEAPGYVIGSSIL